MYERWVSKPASSAAETALHLKRYAEWEQEVVHQMGYRHIKIEMEMRINAPREKVFAAFTTNYDKWWPHRYHDDSTCSVEAKAGGHIYEQFKAGGGAITGTVVYIEPPYKLATSGPSSLGRGLSSYSVATCEEDGENTLFKRSMELWGSISEEVEKMYRDGGHQLMEVALRGYLEEGKEYSKEVKE
jgi:uncharacterized protein YndB with AHSA1/START domain